ncbi:MAG TPA: NAD(P)H-dependent oxidoreductase [Gemmatimonadaceae bacterium]
MARDVVVIVGSLRRDSFTRKFARAVAGLAPTSLVFDFVEIGALPMYNADLETDSPPHEWVAFRERIRRCDAVLFATPEHNRSVPAALKNAIDIGSRPTGKGAWSGKPAAVLSVSPGAIGAFGANHHLRQMLVFLNMPTLQQPEAYVGGAAKLINEQAEIINEGTKEFLTKFASAFERWIELIAPAEVRTYPRRPTLM